jgi:hypothetical protein
MAQGTEGRDHYQKMLFGIILLVRFKRLNASTKPVN